MILRRTGTPCHLKLTSIPVSMVHTGQHGAAVAAQGFKKAGGARRRLVRFNVFSFCQHAQQRKLKCNM